MGTNSGLTRLGAGLDNQVLVSDSAASIGVRWTSLGGSVPAATTSAIGTVQLATNSAVTNYLNGSNTATGALAVTISNVATALQKGIAFGNGSANATFANINATGTATLGTPLYATSGGTGYSSYNDGDMLVGNALGGLAADCRSRGLGHARRQRRAAWAAHENVADATTNSSGVVTLATAQETVALSSTTKVATPAGLAALLQSPPNIGSQNAAGATFSSLSVTGPWRSTRASRCRPRTAVLARRHTVRETCSWATPPAVSRVSVGSYGQGAHGRPQQRASVEQHRRRTGRHHHPERNRAARDRRRGHRRNQHRQGRDPPTSPPCSPVRHHSDPWEPATPQWSPI